MQRVDPDNTQMLSNICAQSSIFVCLANTAVVVFIVVSPLLYTRRRNLGRFRVRYVKQLIASPKYDTIFRSITGPEARESVQLTLELLTEHAVEEDVGGLLPLEALSRRNHGMHSAESMANAALHKPRADDIFISTYPKCGLSSIPSTCTIIHLTKPRLHDTFARF